MLIVDAQIHLWNAGNPTSPWHRQVPAYLKDDALKEMDAAGAQELLMPALQPIELWKESGRYATFGDLLTKPVEKGGMNLGTVGASAVLTAILVASIMYTQAPAPHRGRRK